MTYSRETVTPLEAISDENWGVPAMIDFARKTRLLTSRRRTRNLRKLCERCETAIRHQRRRKMASLSKTINNKNLTGPSNDSTDAQVVEGATLRLSRLALAISEDGPWESDELNLSDSLGLNAVLLGGWERLIERVIEKTKTKASVGHAVQRAETLNRLGLLSEAEFTKIRNRAKAQAPMADLVAAAHAEQFGA